MFILDAGSTPAYSNFILLYSTSNFKQLRIFMTPENFPYWLQYLHQEKPRDVYYLNTEGRCKERDIEEIILSTEEYLQIAERIIIEEPECVLTIDTYPALCTASTYSNFVGE